jgi:hypothetical protein
MAVSWLLPSSLIGLGRPPLVKTAATSAKDVDIRNFSLANRQMLAKGQRIGIFAGNAAIIDLPRPLFVATSTKTDLLTNDRIELSEDIDRSGVLSLVKYLKDMLAWHGFNLFMPNNMGMYDMLSITSAAAALGMDMYVDHVYRKCEAYLRKELPSYEDLDALTYFAVEHPRLLHITASFNLAVRMRQGTIPDTDKFAEYLEVNVVLGEQIQLATTKHEEWVERGEWREARAQRAIETKALFATRKVEAMEDEKSIQAKLKLPVGKRQFTIRERAHWRRTRGTKLPKGC